MFNKVVIKKNSCNAKNNTRDVKTEEMKICILKMELLHCERKKIIESKVGKENVKISNFSKD